MEEIRLGHRNRLEVLREVEFGLYLDAGQVGEVLLPARYVPQGTRVGDTLDVFLYLDSEERLTATTEQPLVEVGQFAYLQVVWVNKYGAFLHWGLTKDLFCPFAEQKVRMEQGHSYLVYCYIDPHTYRITASAKVEHFLSDGRPTYEAGQAVQLLIQQQTPLGLKAIVDGRFLGLLPQNEIHQPLRIGDRVEAYVTHVREDGKIDLSLQPHFGFLRVRDFSAELLRYLQQQPGFYCPLHDKSEAEEINAAFGVSKKTFKRAVGDLLKHRLLELLPNGIRLTPSGINRK